MNHHYPKLLWCGSYNQHAWCVRGSRCPAAWLGLRAKVFLLFVNCGFEFLNTSEYDVRERCWQPSQWHHCTPSSPWSRPPQSQGGNYRMDSLLGHFRTSSSKGNVSTDFSALSSPVAWGNKQTGGARKRCSRSRHVILAPGSASASPQAREEGFWKQVF